MGARGMQTYRNHVRHDIFLYFCSLLLLVSIALAGAGLYWSEKLVGVAVIVNSIAMLCLALNARGYGTTVQDRIIRLEMRIRLKEVLGGDPLGRIRDFTLSQLIGLRFASDEELSALSQEVLEKHITDVDQIKQMVNDWQPDHLRV